MRGKHNYADDDDPLMRITPAHAGKTAGGIKTPASSADHPRACGENLTAVFACPSQLGSPPRMRGKPTRLGQSRKRGRITPAHAGKTEVQADLSKISADHPRACGENYPERLPFVKVFGSPPRMRGKLSNSVAQFCTPRITPAHAGKTRVSC